jgi:hypothetical protein
MGYRLLAGRAGARSAEGGMEPRIQHPVPGMIVGFFGMCIIAFVLLRDAPRTVQGQAEQQHEASSDGADGFSPGPKPEAAAPSVRPTNSDFFSNVRESVEAPNQSPGLVPPEPRTFSNDVSLPREVRTKGAYVPFTRPPVNDARPTDHGAVIVAEPPPRGLFPLTNRPAPDGETNRPIRAPFKMRIANP